MPTRRSSLARAAAALVLAAALACGAPVAAWAAGMNTGGSDDPAASAESTATAAVDENAEPLGLMPHLLRLTGESRAAEGEGVLPTESVGALFPNLLSVATTPQSISTGIQCHMDEVCGYDPCTCGKPDAWGHCACGGFEETVPTVSISTSDANVATVVEAFGQTWILPVSPGTATITIAADLIHYQSASYAFSVEVAPFGIVDALLIVAALLLVAGIFAGLFFLVRLVVRIARRKLAERRQWKARGEELKREFPLTWRAKLTSEQYARTRRGRRRRAGHRRPFAHDLLFSLRQALPVLLAGLALFVVLVPVSTSVVNDISVFNVNYTHEQLKYQFFAQDLAPVVNAACVLFGAVLAVVLFRFLLVKRATTAFFSVGLSRMKLFFSRYAAGALCIVAGIAVPFAISLVLNYLALGLYEGEVHEFFFVTCGYVTVALVSFSLAGIAVICAGTLFETCSFAVALLAGVSVVLWGVGMLADYLLVGNAAGALLYGQAVEVAPSFLSDLSWLNPLLFFADAGGQHQFFMALHPVYFPELGSWRLVVGWFAAYLALSAFGLLALCRRRGEQAEMAGKSPVFSLFAVAVFGLAAFSAAVALLGSVDVNVALVVGAALFVLVSLVLLFGPLRGRTPRRTTLGCVGGELVVMAAVVGAVATGAFGYASYIPETDQVESVEVSYNGSPSYLTQGFSGVASGASYYYTSYRSYAQESSIDIVRSLHDQLIGSARAARETNYTDFQSSVVPYDVVLRYRMKDGGEVVRYYRQASIGELSAMLALDNDAHTHELENAVVTGETSGLSDDERAALSESPSYNAYRAGSIYVGDGALNRIMAVECTDEERAALLQALAADLADLNANERYLPSKPTRVALMFTLSPELDVASFGYSFSNAVSYVTDDWTRTMAWLEGKGLVEALGTALDSHVIEQLTFQLDDPYASINKVTQPVSRYFMAYRSSTAGQYWITQDFGALKVVDEQDKIADIVPNLRTGCYMTGGYLVQAKLRGIEAYVYFYLPAELAPSYL